MTTYETLTKKADRLLEIGDRLGYRTVEGKRALRKCRHYRRLAKIAKQKTKS